MYAQTYTFDFLVNFVTLLFSILSFIWEMAIPSLFGHLCK